MGYTHYFQQKEEMNPDVWARFTANANQLITKASTSIRLDFEITENYLRVNGVLANSHEDFYLARTDMSWNFCKTNHKPYDVVVTAILILLRYTYPSFALSSDGSWGEWSEGRELFADVFCLEPSNEWIFDNENFIYPVRSLA